MLDSYLSFITYNWGSVIISILFIMYLLNFGTGILEEQLSVIGKKLRIPNSVRGATFDAASSSLPEFLTSLAGLMILKEKGLEVGIGTIGGSAIFNILIIPALVLLFYKGKKLISVESKGVKRDSLFYVASILILLLGLYFDKLAIMSVFLIGLYAFYIYFLYRNSLEHRKNNEELVEEAYLSVKDTKISYFKILFSLFLIYIGVEASVVAAQWIGEQLHISVLIVSLILLASITSIPDALLSIKSSKKGDIDAGLSNAVGSNIFDICIGLGIPILIGIIFMGLNPNVDFNSQFPIFVFLIISTLLYFIILNKKSLSKLDGLYLLAFYIIFISYLVWQI